MEETNFYTDIKESVEEIFSFLQSDFQFSAFIERQIAYEMHFETKNDFVSIDIWFEAIVSTPIWIKIDEFYVDNLEPNNSVIQNYSKKLSELYEPLDENPDTKCFEFEFSQYRKYGKELNSVYLTEIANMLKRHSFVLQGDFDLLETNTKVIIENNKKIKDQERIEKGIYTIEYQFFCINENEYDMYEEFQNINEIKSYLAERPEIKVYRVLDCYMNEINLYSPE